MADSRDDLTRLCVRLGSSQSMYADAYEGLPMSCQITQNILQMSPDFGNFKNLFLQLLRVQNIQKNYREFNSLISLRKWIIKNGDMTENIRLALVS